MVAFATKIPHMSSPDYTFLYFLIFLYFVWVLEREPRTFIHVKRAKRFDPVG